MPRLGPLLTLVALAVLTAGSGAAAESRGRVAVVQGGDESRLVVIHPDGSGARTLVRRESDSSRRPGGLTAARSRSSARAAAARGSMSSTTTAPGCARSSSRTAGREIRRSPPMDVASRTSEGAACSSRGPTAPAPNAEGLLARCSRTPSPTWSPDGTRIAFVRETQDMRVYLCVVAVRTTRIRRLTRTTEWAASPAWAPNGKSLAFVRMPVNSDVGRLAITRPDGRGLRNLAPHLGDVVDLSWSPDSRELAFTRKIRPDSESSASACRTTPSER